MPGGKRLKLDPNGCEDKETLSASDSFEVEDCELKRKKACSKARKELELEGKEKEHQAEEVEELILKEQAILWELQEKQEQLEREGQDLKLKIQAELETSFKERETALMVQLTDQREMLLSEERQALEMKDMEQKLLESQSNETKQENVTAKLQNVKAREDILPNFSELMEMELQCAVCNELLIKATSLNCSHVFCKLCIGQWMKVKMECPNCRCPITSQLPVIALDSYIDKMVELFNSDERQQRSELLQLRKVEQEKFDAAETDSSAVATTYMAEAEESRDTGNSRHRGRSRGTDTSSWEDEYDEGIPDAYYSGNGQSYNCDTSSWEDEYDEGIPDAYYSGNGQSYNCDTSSWEDEYDEGIPDAYYSGNGQSYNCVNHPDSSSWEDEYDEGIPDACYSGNGQSYNCAAATSPQADITSRFIQISGENSISIVNYPDSLSWENEYDGGIPDAYYNGYGQCYICGLRSHSSDECPFWL